MRSSWAFVVALVALAGLVSQDVFARGNQREWYDRFLVHSEALASFAADAELVAPTVGDIRTANDLLSEMQVVGAEGGGTSSPFALRDTADGTTDGTTGSGAPDTAGGQPEMPDAGYAVALEGSDMIIEPVLRRPLPRGASDDSTTSDAYVAERDRFWAWYADVYPLMTTGHVWVGYYWNDATGDMEINLTVVLDDRDLAVALGVDQNQWSIWDFDAADVIATNDHGPQHWERPLGTRRIRIPSGADELVG